MLEFLKKHKVISYVLILTLISLILGVIGDFIPTVISVVIVLIIIITLSIFLESIFNKIKDKYKWDNPPKFYFYLSIFIPFVGFIMWCVFVNHKPNSARSSGRGALCSVLLYLLTFISLFYMSFVIDIVGSIKYDLRSDNYIHTLNVDLSICDEFKQAYVLEDDNLEVKVKYSDDKEVIKLLKEGYILKEVEIRFCYKEIQKENPKEFYDIKNNVEELIEDWIERDSIVSNLEYEILDNRIIAKLYNRVSTNVSGFISDSINIEKDTLVDVYIYSENEKEYSKIVEKARLNHNLQVNESGYYGFTISGSESQLSNIDFDEYAIKGFANLLIVANGESFRYNGYKEVNISEFKKLYDDYKKTFVSRSVPLKVNPLTDKEIKEIKTNINEAVIKGPKNIIDDIEFIEVEVYAFDIDRNKKYNVSITKPNGVETISPSSVEIEVILKDEE